MARRRSKQRKAPAAAAASSATEQDTDERLCRVKLFLDKVPKRLEVLGNSYPTLGLYLNATKLDKQNNDHANIQILLELCSDDDAHTSTAILCVATGASAQVTPLENAPLESAVRGDCPDMVALLVSLKADVGTITSGNFKGGAGHTALHRAAMFGSPKAAQALLEAGADVEVLDVCG